MSGRPWTAAELDRLRELYPVTATSRVAVMLRRSRCGVYACAGILGLHKTLEYYDSDESGRLRKGQTRPASVATQFRKGHVPANKGLRRPGWAPGRMKETQFRKGNRSGAAAQNWQPIGTILQDTEGYLRIKVRDGVHGQEPTGFGNSKVWPLYARHVWEQHYGPVPPSHVIAFKDRDRSNCAIENLECISRADLARRNAMWARYPEDLIHAVMLNGALKRKMREAQR